MVDPLTLLRHYHIHKKDIIERDNQIIFGEFSWPKNVETNYIIHKPKKDNSPKKYYTLECLLFILKNSSHIHPTYVRKALVANIPAVRRPDRKQLLAYLNGETVSCPAIDKSAPLEIPTQVLIPPKLESPTQHSLLQDIILDRKELLAYLNGETDSCPANDKSAPLEIPTQVLIRPKLESPPQDSL